MYAINVDGEKIEPTPYQRAKCPCCKNEVLSKCGEINSWHWAHLHDSNCEYKEMTEWHFRWQRKFPKENVEVLEIRNGEKRVADVKLDNGTVLEFHHSNIQSETIRDRENFHGVKNLIWIFDVTNKSTISMAITAKGKIFVFWRNVWRTALECKARVFLNIGDDILLDTKSGSFYIADCYTKGQQMLKSATNLQVFSAFFNRRELFDHEFYVSTRIEKRHKSKHEVQNIFANRIINRTEYLPYEKKLAVNDKNIIFVEITDFFRMSKSKDITDSYVKKILDGEKDILVPKSKEEIERQISSADKHLRIFGSVRGAMNKVKYDGIPINVENVSIYTKEDLKDILMIMKIFKDEINNYNKAFEPDEENIVVSDKEILEKAFG